MKKSKQLKNIHLSVIAAALLLLCIAGYISAFFISTDAKINRFVIADCFTKGNITISLLEPSFTDTYEALPEQRIPKDPEICNNSEENDAYVFLKIRIPRRNAAVYTEAEDKTIKQQSMMRDMYEFIKNDGWYELAEEKNVTDTFTEYVYAYGSSSSCIKLPAGGTTNPLFNSVSLIPFIEGQGLDTDNLNIDIQAYGIQTELADAEKPEEIWNILKSE